MSPPPTHTHIHTQTYREFHVGVKKFRFLQYMYIFSLLSCGLSWFCCSVILKKKKNTYTFIGITARKRTRRVWRSKRLLQKIPLGVKWCRGVQVCVRLQRDSSTIPQLNSGLASFQNQPRSFQGFRVLLDVKVEILMWRFYDSVFPFNH